MSEQIEQIEREELKREHPEINEEPAEGGTGACVKKYSLALRRGDFGDADLLFAWRNDPLVRNNSFHHESVRWEEHVQWYKALLEDRTRFQYILTADRNALREPQSEAQDAERGTEPDDESGAIGSAHEPIPETKTGEAAVSLIHRVPVGQIRIAVEDEKAEIGYSIAEEYRGKGFGTAILYLLEQYLIATKEAKADELIGRVIPANRASQNAFLRNGYVQKAKTEQYIEFHKALLGRL